MKIDRKAILLGVIMLASAPQWAYATPIAIPDAGGSLNYLGVSHSFSGSTASGSFGCGTLSVSGSPLPTLSATASSCDDGGQAIFFYSFEILGPSATVSVSISSTAVLTATGDYQAGYSLGITGETLHVDNCLHETFYDGGCGTHSFTDVRSFQTNTIFTVSMMTATSNFLGAGSGSAFLDPILTIDPALGSQYSLVFSAGIGNTLGDSASVPEPGTLTLMGLGLLGIAAARRARSYVF